MNNGDGKDRDLVRLQALGWTFAMPEVVPGLDVGRDLVLAPGPNGLDLATVEGIDALSQSLAVALTTRLGDDVFNTAFGFDGLNALAEEPNPALMRERVRIGVIKVLRKENRVRRIVDVGFAGDDRLSPPVVVDAGGADAASAGFRALDVRVVFEAVGGDTAAVDLGKVVFSG
ncbi:hypothetical protein [Aquisphaera insulae]|uniref:hypothetical protein n=1 Tax=Aquisphaera insulae TaxID=2712864 RepID=UPI0013EB56F8|nr:hypothetical protein [Aquisphaera insulae]